MAKRQLHPDGTNGSSGILSLTFSFVANGSANPTITTSATGAAARGDGLLPGTAGTVAVTHTNTGKFTVVLDPGYTCRYLVTKGADLEDSGSGDGGWATITAPSQGEGDGKAMTFIVFLWQNSAGSNTLTDFTGRRVSVTLEMKLTAAGA